MTVVLALVGSLRADSTNRKIAELAQRLAPEGTEVRIAEGLGEVPFYNEDIDGADAPAAAERLREQVAAADALLLVTPEYNGGLPAVLKNAIDWASRPYGQGSITGKPAAALGAAFGQFGGVWAHQDSLKSVKIAGAKPHEEPAGSFKVTEWTGSGHPEEQADVVEAVTRTLETLTQQARETAAA
ncbi:NAD(P)H-dependent oxidoreductase [Luteipulveratus sp. YIM 133132]|uniref:NAD(P)H-dependent oxidoreductase n=1 Tax=Luteipulveratus flavus TaxID=3031728 RepID=A0ABT6C648_9MICO|nr:MULTISPECIES: NADPH-dependent FMN reductase [unclassified Luteipulveratus]MDE9365297.1 NAD(P)H-dependent oxidoreductase [Luteipulveratus sp. YIM 133132]MDF8264365.1 NAD(P)H-dependent oxidoreductase [Luteipulveratus sp. YIM 133296]